MTKIEMPKRCPKLFIIAGHSLNDSGAVANGYKESQLTMELRGLIAKHIDSFVWDVHLDNDSKSLAEVIRWVNDNSDANDLVIDLHFNASVHSNATGAEVFIHDKTTKANAALAANLNNIAVKTLDIPNRGVKTEKQSQHTRLGILHTKPKAILIEVCFMSNNTDMVKYQRYKEAYAKTLANELNNFGKTLNL